MTELNTLPRGLAALLQIKSQNDIPKAIFDEVMLGIDIKDFLIEGLSPETINSTLAGFDSATVTGTNTIDAQLFGFTRSDNEMVIVQCASLRTFGVSGLVTLKPMGAYISWPIGGASQAICQVTPDRSDARIAGSFVYDGVQHLVVPPGGSFGFHVQTIGAAPATTYSVAFAARYARLRV